MGLDMAFLRKTAVELRPPYRSEWQLHGIIMSVISPRHYRESSGSIPVTSAQLRRVKSAFCIIRGLDEKIMGDGSSIPLSEASESDAYYYTEIVKLIQLVEQTEHDGDSAMYEYSY